jgi:4-amino-4-deoxy-L-arabinose transferase-like glycosyltransferase
VSSIPPSVVEPSRAVAGPERRARGARTRIAGLDRAWAAVAVGTLVLLATAGATGLFEPTETRFAEIAREMRASGDWWVPRLNGLPHYHKPPLAYWATVLGFSTLGENSWGARIPVALATALGLAAVALAVRRRFAALGCRPGVTVWLLASAVLPFGLGRALATDPYLATAIAGYWALAPSAWALAAIGLGFAIKGPVVLVFTAAPVLVAAARGRERRTLRLLGPPAGWALAAAIALPWYLAVAARTPGLLGYFLGNQIWQRYATTVHGRQGPWWYFIATLLLGFLPWTPPMLAGIARAWHERGREDSRLLLAWLAVPLVFLSFSGSKLSAYLLPAFPAAAALAALGWERAGRVTRMATAALLAAVAAFVAFGVPPLVAEVSRLTAAELVMPGRWVAMTCLLAGSMLAWRGRAGGAGAMTLAAWIALVVTLAPFQGFIGTPQPLARVLAENRRPDEPVVVYERFNAGLAFYLREPVRLLDVPREDQFADPATLSRVYATGDSLVGWAGTRGRVWMLGRRETLPALADSLGLSWTRVADWRRLSLGFLEPRTPR